MKRRWIFIVLFIIFGSTSIGQYVTLQGRQFKDENGDDFDPLVCNYNVCIAITDTSDFSTTFISPIPHLGSSGDLECQCQDSCDSILRNDFKQLLYMGFNTVRIMGIHPYYLPTGVKKDNCDWTSPETAFYIPTEWVDHVTGCPVQFVIQNPYTNDTAQRLYELIDHLITLMSDVEYNGKRLKLILISGGHQGIFSLDFPSDYTTYLGSMTNALSASLSDSAKTILFAWDLFNEPRAFWPDSIIGHSKQDVCNNVSSWYDAVKEEDSDHLITLGGGGFKDIWEYDPAILKLDFYSAHIYPSAHIEYEDSTYFEAMVNRIYGNLFWLQNNCPMPWIIGENGLKAIDNSSFGINYDGTLTEQYNYADSVTYQTWDCGGSGFSWWFYQDVGSPPGDGFGILKFRKTCGDNWPCDSILKPVWEVFDEFAPPVSGACSEPPYYYDPYYHDFYGKDTNIVTGYVLDQDSVPIKDAWIFAQTRLYTEIVPGIPDNDTLDYYDNHYTFSTDIGFFKIFPYDYIEEEPNWHTVERIVISAPGCSRLESGKWGNWGGVDSGLTYILDRFDFNYEDSFESLTITANDSIVLQAWDMVSLTNIEVQQNAYFEAKARTEISVSHEFTAATGSETWIHTEKTFYPCDNLSSFFKSTTGSFSYEEINEININKEIILNFITVKQVFDVRLYPNPGPGAFSLDILCSEPVIELHMVIYDQYGKELLLRFINEKSLSLDLTYLSKGIYFVQLKNMEHQITTKLIII